MPARVFLALAFALWLPIALWTATAVLDRQARPTPVTGVLE